MADPTALHAREAAYREASRAFDYFMTGLAAVFFLVTALSLEAHVPVVSALDLVSVVLFTLALIAGLRKLENYVTILGTDYSIALTQSGGSGLAARDAAAVLEDLADTLEKLSMKASLVHRARNWFLVLGIVACALSRILETYLPG
jgi:hypothetical protein